MRRTARAPSGLSLVELLIVLAVLAILAAAVLPRLGAASDTARTSTARTQLVTLRQQLELWRLDHGGRHPSLTEIQIGEADWLIFLRPTRPDGKIDSAGERGPYMSSAPVNPYTHSPLVVSAGASAAGAGWVYDERDGTLKILLPSTVDPKAAELGPSDFVRQ